MVEAALATPPGRRRDRALGRALLGPDGKTPASHPGRSARSSSASCAPKKPMFLVVNKVDTVPKPLLLPFVAALARTRSLRRGALPLGAHRATASRSSSRPLLARSPRAAPLFPPTPSPTSGARPGRRAHPGAGAPPLPEEVPHSSAVRVDVFDESEREPRPGRPPGALQGLVRIQPAVSSSATARRPSSSASAGRC